MKYLVVFILLVFTNFKSTAQATTKPISKTDTIAEKQAKQYLDQLQIEYRNGKYEAHKKYSDSFHNVAKENGLIKYQVLAMVNQAVYYNNKSEQNTSISLYRNAFTLCEAIPEDYRTKIIVLVNLGNVYNNIEAYKKVISTMEQVLSLVDNLEVS